MVSPAHTIRVAVFALAVAGAVGGRAALAEERERNPCTEDAMLVFDASGSMAGVDGLGIATPVTRIDRVREALGKVLPNVTRFRRVGLMTYGPGPYNKCDNIKLNLAPTVHAADRIMSTVNNLTPAGSTPLTLAVGQAAEVLDFRARPGVIVLLTDGEDTCGGSPCAIGKELHAAAEQLTIHVISYRPKNFFWTGEQSILEVRCLADQNGGLYITAETTDELIAAFEKTLGCPMVTQRDLP